MVVRYIALIELSSKTKMGSKTLHNRRKAAAGSGVVALLFDEDTTRAAIELANMEDEDINYDTEKVRASLEAADWDMARALAAADPETARALAASLRDRTRAETIFSFVKSKIESTRFPLPNLPRSDPGMEGTLFTADWAAGREIAQKWLPKIAKLESMSVAARRAFIYQVNSYLSLIAQFHLQLTTNGLAMILPQDSIFGATVRGLLPFLLPNGWPSSRLGQCSLKGCGRYFLRPEARRGRVPMYCGPEHGNSAHVRAFRDRQKQQAHSKGRSNGQR